MSTASKPMEIIKALLLAAGEGKRLRPYTERLPKPMISIADKPILERNIHLLADYGIREVAINLHHCPKVVMDHFGDGSDFGVHITYSYEPELLGTAGAVKKLQTFFQGTFLVIYSDNLVDCNLERLIAFHHEHGGMATIALHYRGDVSQSGVVALNGNERVTNFLEKPQANQAISHWVNAGLFVLEQEVFKHIPPRSPSDFGREIFPSLLGQGEKIYGYRLGEDEAIWWIDRVEDYERVQQIFSNRLNE